MVVRQLANDSRFCNLVDEADVCRLIVASLLHDVGHWPYCHPIEDLKLETSVPHELFAQQYILDDELASIIREQWLVEPETVTELIYCPREKKRDGKMKLLQSILSGPIDIDKIDYLYRDSLHAGVPYGSNFDKKRLISNLCINESGDGLAVNEKGRTAAELLVFARYVMFSEVYWHHTVRSATAMLQRAFFEIQQSNDITEFYVFNDSNWRTRALQLSLNRDWFGLLDGVFGFQRKLFKRIAEYDSYEVVEVYAEIARRPYPWIVQCSNRFAEILASKIGHAVAPTQVLIDSPPIGLEVQFEVDVFYPKTGRYRSLGEVSPVTKTLATSQFDDFVKRVRIFVAPEIKDSVPSNLNVTEILYEAAAF